MILYFSGTGNSRYAAERIGAQTGETPVSLNDRIRAGDLTPLPAAPSFVIVAPTYAWRLPRPVERHLRAGVLPRGAAVWFVLTCGDGAGAAALYCRRLCADLGLRFFGLRAVVMPENYLALFPVPTEAESRAAVRRADPVLAETGARIAAGQPLPDTPVTWKDRLCSGPVNALFYRFVIRDRAFFATDACTGCGACAARCPLGDIRMEDGRPRWGGHCTHCMACIARCPQAAIEYGKRTAGRPRWHLD